ncbi:Putative palmitoyltransferase ZDHHC1 [Chelonia mydas]|uniref:Palmitoyltransferase n=1 Tax=Chelonia mydas TaxID=8469 RepID=M7ASI6_CHEMY|nr:Putative palmitoyltransferase ZDHHC1 [Chelonia mydas]
MPLAQSGMVPHLLFTAAAIVAFRVSPSTPTEHLSQIRKRKKRTQDDMFQKILQASSASDSEHRARRMNIVDSLEKDRVKRRKCPGVFFICHLVVHFTAVSIDPADANVRENKYLGQLATFSRNQHAHVIENRHCHVCDVDVSSRSKHCGTCNKCVCGFDHHCKWLNNCVGERNYWLFLNSVVSAILGLVLLLLIAFYVFVEFFINPMMLRTNQHLEVLKNDTDIWFVFLPAAPIETQAPAILVLAGILILLGLLTVILLGHLLIFHIYLMWNKLTTYEYIVQQRPRQEMKEEVGFYAGNLGYTNPGIQREDSSTVASGRELSKFGVHNGGADPELNSSPELPALQSIVHTQQQKKRKKKKVHKVPSSDMAEKSKTSSQPRRPLPATQTAHARGDGEKNLYPGHLVKRKSCQRASDGEQELELLSRIPAVFVSESSDQAAEQKETCYATFLIAACFKIISK